ncbi:receptor-like protein 56 [Vigna unguiculata]|uniref:receptor-like protein 56 n=1 Tax=Vigna unguiculata TaxID=3917 RepID=UPI001016850B|nr:receptor-like protein 56 [Vigna unguiculata]
MKKISVFTFWLILVLLGVLCCEGCWKHEKEALANINSVYFDNNLPWVDTTDCCKWDRVECNSTTGRVVKLDLSYGSDYHHGYWILNYSHFLVFEDLKNLNLSSNDIYSCVETEALGLNNLEVLDLSNNSGTHNILSCVLESSSLKVLYLQFNNFDATSYQGLFSMLVNLEVLDLTMCEFSDDDIASALSALPSLKSLNLESCTQLNWRPLHSFSKLRTLEILYLTTVELDDSNLRSSEKEEFAWPSNLQFLGLSRNSFSKKVFSSLSGLRHLKSLDISGNDLEGSLNISGLTSSNLETLDFSRNHITNFVENQDWSGLKMLKELNISYNKFKGPLQPYFADFSSLRKLDLSNNHFTGNIGSSLASLTSLEYLGFEGNQFEVPVSFTPFFNHSNLKFIYGNGNKVILDSHSSMKKWVPKFQLQVLSLSSTTESHSLPIPSFLHYQYNLTLLDFTGCRLEGEFPKWLLENNTKMTYLVLKNCSFTQFQVPSHPHLHLAEMIVSHNAISGQIMRHNISSFFPNLEILDMSENAISGSVPREFGLMKLLQTLDLSSNHLSGEIPHELINMSSLKTLDLSDNQLTKVTFGVGHRYTGSISSLDISNNQLVGKIPSLIKNMSGLEHLSMSNNHFEGSIPQEFAELKNLIYLDLSQNNLTGEIPPFVSSSVKSIHLNNNHLTGLSKRTFRGGSSLELLELSHNEVTHNIEDMVEDIIFIDLKILLVKGNHFNGDIPSQLCKLKGLTILDFSHNNLTGVIPRCLGRMPFYNEDPEELRRLFYGIIRNTPNSRFDRQIPNVEETANFTTKGRTDTYMGSILAYMSAIDLSHNKLKGNIPSELGNLKRIQSLDLSHNDLTGKIPTTFSKLRQTESLDLSFNKLSGQIPSQLSELTFLSSFNVSYNNLSGAIERRGQFLTFEESCFRGNPLLCGPPLARSCNPEPDIFPSDSDNGNSGSWLDKFVFCVTFAVSYASFLLVTAAALYINPYWRQLSFYYAELVSLNCYYFVEDNMCKFCNLGTV